MIFIVIPVYNRLVFTIGCLDALRNQTVKDFSIIVVDHGSTDRTSEYINQNYPEVHLINGDSTMWWSAASNLGIRSALSLGATHILTLNNDTLPLVDYVENLYRDNELMGDDALIGSSAISAVTGDVIYQGERVNWFRESSQRIVISEYHTTNRVVDVSLFPGRGLLIPVKVFNKVGLFDDIAFPHYMADYDFTLRAKKAGFQLYCSLNAKIGIFPEESGANQLKIRKSLQAYKQHLFGMKGGANLPLFFRYVFRHCPPLAIPTHLFFGTSRRLLGYWFK